MRRIKAKANAMEDADVNFISLVTRPASRIPFRITKSDDPEEGVMIHLKQMFKRDGDAPKSCALAAVVLQSKHEDHFTPELEKLGLKIDDRVEQDDIVILKQSDFDENEVTAVKLGEVGGLFIGVPESVQKAFDPFTETDDFDENMALSFLPGMSAATEALFTTVMTVLRSSDSPEDARSRIESNIDKYKAAVMDMASNLPEMAFKLEALSLEGFEEPVEKEEVDVDGDNQADDATAGAGDEVQKSDDGESGEEEKEEAVSKEEGGSDLGLSDEEKEALKGVHIEDLDVEEPQETAEKADEEESDETVEKSEPEDLLAVLNSFKSEVLEAVSGVKSEVSDLKKSQDSLAEKVATVEEAAGEAQKAVKGTVPSHSDFDESLGTRQRKRRSETDADEATWGGTALDRIAGDFR